MFGFFENKQMELKLPKNKCPPQESKVPCQMSLNSMCKMQKKKQQPASEQQIQQQQSTTIESNKCNENVNNEQHKDKMQQLLSIPISCCQYCIRPSSNNNNYSMFYFQSQTMFFNKYSSSQNYYYCKDINDILSGSSLSLAVIKFKDLRTMDEDEEYLKRYYAITENGHKMQQLCEYYKYHSDVARLFMLPTTTILNKFIDRKRKLEYERVSNLIQQQQKAKSILSQDDYQNLNLNGSISANKQKQINLSKGSQYSILLKELETPQASSKKIKIRPQNRHNQDYQLICEKHKRKVQQSNDNSIQTIDELNQKLGEIIKCNGNSHSRSSISLFENSQSRHILNSPFHLQFDGEQFSINNNYDDDFGNAINNLKKMDQNQRIANFQSDFQKSQNQKSDFNSNMPTQQLLQQKKSYNNLQILDNTGKLQQLNKVSNNCDQQLQLQHNAVSKTERQFIRNNEERPFNNRKGNQIANIMWDDIKNQLPIKYQSDQQNVQQQTNNDESSLKTERFKNLALLIEQQKALLCGAGGSQNLQQNVQTTTVQNVEGIKQSFKKKFHQLQTLDNNNSQPDKKQNTAFSAQSNLAKQKKLLQPNFNIQNIQYMNQMQCMNQMQARGAGCGANKEIKDTVFKMAVMNFQNQKKESVKSHSLENCKGKLIPTNNTVQLTNVNGNQSSNHLLVNSTQLQFLRFLQGRQKSQSQSSATVHSHLLTERPTTHIHTYTQQQKAQSKQALQKQQKSTNLLISQIQKKQQVINNNIIQKMRQKSVDSLTHLRPQVGNFMKLNDDNFNNTTEKQFPSKQVSYLQSSLENSNINNCSQLNPTFILHTQQKQLGNSKQKTNKILTMRSTSQASLRTRSKVTDPIQQQQLQQKFLQQQSNSQLQHASIQQLPAHQNSNSSQQFQFQNQNAVKVVGKQKQYNIPCEFINTKSNLKIRARQQRQPSIGGHSYNNNNYYNESSQLLSQQKCNANTLTSNMQSQQSFQQQRTINDNNRRSYENIHTNINMKGKHPAKTERPHTSALGAKNQLQQNNIVQSKFTMNITKLKQQELQNRQHLSQLKKSYNSNIVEQGIDIYANANNSDYTNINNDNTQNNMYKKIIHKYSKSNANINQNQYSLNQLSSNQISQSNLNNSNSNKLDQQQHNQNNNIIKNNNKAVLHQQNLKGNFTQQNPSNTNRNMKGQKSQSHQIYQY